MKDGGRERSDSKHVDGKEASFDSRTGESREESGKSQRKEGGRKEEERASGGSEWKEGAESVI